MALKRSFGGENVAASATAFLPDLCCWWIPRAPCPRVLVPTSRAEGPRLTSMESKKP